MRVHLPSEGELERKRQIRAHEDALRHLLMQQSEVAAVRELLRINEMLREAGFEYPGGSEGVADLINMFKEQQHRLESLEK